MTTYAKERKYDKLSNFTSLKDFNDQFEQVMIDVKDQFTKSEYIALNKLRKFAGSDIVGVAWVKLQKVVSSTWAETIGVSRSTFERMIRKARKLNLIAVVNQSRKNGSQTHNVYVFRRADEIILPQAETEIVSNSHTIDVAEPLKIDAPITNILIKLPKLKDKENTYATQSVSEVNDNVDLEPKSVIPYERFKAYVSNFITDKTIASKLYGIYRAHTCKLIAAPDIDIAFEALKETLRKYKQGKVRSITGYFNGTLSNMIDNYMLEQVFVAREEFEKEHDFLLNDADLPEWLQSGEQEQSTECQRLLFERFGITG
ncbi:hypothetical protein [Caryophanon tenue]|uniref:Helix-turn-helix domain-containing protein n=1 Tax=Caryophanon tenue TaxID=33978 RepID=A0A1C0Y545_9BACL|nr:hypothetical protein [Caryophanon tenue]OCS82255.1 hypothetical protein A6M13_07415 [Caryophanon tenue]